MNVFQRNEALDALLAAHAAMAISNENLSLGTAMICDLFDAQPEYAKTGPVSTPSIVPAVLDAHFSAFESVNTHELRQGDIVRCNNMVVRVGLKQISDSGCHADTGYGVAHYHLSDILESDDGMPAPGSRQWNVQGNRLATWSRYVG